MKIVSRRVYTILRLLAKDINIDLNDSIMYQGHVHITGVYRLRFVNQKIY